MTFHATKAKVSNRGTPPDSFLESLVLWGKLAPDVIFAPNSNPGDVYSSVKPILGPSDGSRWVDLPNRRAAMLEVMRVLAGFESSWNWKEGRDVTNSTSVTPETIEAGAWQVSANSMSFGRDLQTLVLFHCDSLSGTKFQSEMKSDKALAMEYIARLLRHTVRHNGPVLRKEIHPWLSRASVREFQDLLA
jgi:hypothetical protein